jgi:hypothetical protein
VGMGDPTGETDKSGLKLDFDRRLLLQFRGSMITSDAGLLAYRELTRRCADRHGCWNAGGRAHRQERPPSAGRVAASIGVRLAGYEDVNDAERLCRDPAMRWVVGDRAIAGFAASASQMGRFETRWLCRAENLAALADLPGQWIGKGARTATAEDDRARHGFELASRRAAPTTGISVAPATTRCSCSTSSAMSSAAP